MQVHRVLSQVGIPGIAAEMGPPAFPPTEVGAPVNMPIWVWVHAEEGQILKFSGRGGCNAVTKSRARVGPVQSVPAHCEQYWIGTS